MPPNRPRVRLATLSLLLFAVMALLAVRPDVASLWDYHWRYPNQIGRAALGMGQASLASRIHVP